MSEELISKGLTKTGIEVGKYIFLDTNRTNINGFKKFGFVENRDYGLYGKREPDGLLIDRSNEKKPAVIAVLEYKSPSEFRTSVQRIDAIQQCNDLCQELGANFGLISDKQNYIWINPKEPNPTNDYNDRTTKAKRSYSIILNEDKKPLFEPFFIQTNKELNAEKLKEETKNTFYYVERILASCNNINSTLITTENIDPTKLAQSVWQDIYINTAKTPVKCLYNVVELFIFKFLSDLEILKSPNDFNTVLKIANDNNPKEALDYYAGNSRKAIKKLFKPSVIDNTTIINGTIFVNDKDEPVESQAILFKNSLKKYNDFGSLKNIKKEFKTKLFEIFLKQTSDKNKLGQFFTPRKVVQSMVDLTDYDSFRDGMRICDPFCGVGGFIVEFLQKPSVKRRFFPGKDGINPKITFLGYDKGMDSDDERTIILAKANMLIYLSDILEKNPNNSEHFSNLLNSTFHLLKDSNLGTLKLTNDLEEEKFDVIITNPPYITGGVVSIKNEIKSDGLEEYYTKNGKGLDGLGLEWIIRNLKKGGKAYVVLSNGLLNSTQNKQLKEYLLQECFLNGIISLPIKTFFNTPQKTYIFTFTKKWDNSDVQNFPIFSYLVSNIGETLDVNRFEIEGKSDIQEAVRLFNQYKGSPNTFTNEGSELRCKLLSTDNFLPEHNWEIDTLWSKEEKIALGIEEEENLISAAEFKEKLTEVPEKIAQCNRVFETLQSEVTSSVKNKEKYILDLFKPYKGNSKYTKKYIRDNDGNYPVYSSQTVKNGVIGYINTFDYNEKCLTWTTDGIYAGTVFLRDGKFNMTGHCGALLLKKEYENSIDLEYVYFYLYKRLKEYAVGEGNKRITIDILKRVTVEIPVKEDGSFDIQKQKEISRTYREIKKVKSDLNDLFDELKNLEIDIKQ